MQEHIWKPLEMDSTTFRVAGRPDIAARLPQIVVRSPSGTLTESRPFTEPWKYVTRDMGGGGMYTSAGGYLKLLMAILRNDGTLLSKTSVAEL
jgi:CubicO group peptidase (beta-lactamase class C family)